jgi:hypothetical protein
VAGCGTSNNQDVPPYGNPPLDSELADFGAGDTTVSDTKTDGDAADTTKPAETSTDAADVAEDVRILPPYGAPSPDVVFL